MAADLPPASRQAGRSRRRMWCFRASAVLLGISALALLEIMLALFDIGRQTDHEDPFVGFSQIYPLFVPVDDGSRYEIPKSRRRFFAPESFPARKRPNTFRIFCLGGSTVQGRPYSKETSFTTWLKLSLSAADADRNWEVVNCGGISYASYRLVPILKECLGYEPDLFIICTGHNEFLEERTYGHIKHSPAALEQVQHTVARLRTYALLRAALSSATGQGTESAREGETEMTADADALLDYRDGIKSFHRDEEFRAGVVAHYEHNVRRMIAIARQADVPVILVRPPSNLSDSPPFKSQHREDLTQTELRRWNALVNEAKRHYGDDLAISIARFQQALLIDDQYAAMHFELGKCYQLTGKRDRAHDAFLRARELDICPLRIITPLEEALAVAAADSRTPLIDAHAILEVESPQGLLGDALLVDHIHPKFRGHQLIAAALTETMISHGWVDPADDWGHRREQAYRKHFNSLEDVYFLRGLRELKALREWAAGRADGPRLDSRTEKKP